MHLKFSHGGPCNIVPGPRGLTGTEHQRLFPDLCGPDFLFQGVAPRERHRSCIYSMSTSKAGAHAEQSALTI